MSTESICLHQLIHGLERLASELRQSPVSVSVVRTILHRVDAMYGGAGIHLDTLEPLLAPLRTGELDGVTGVTAERLRLLARSLQQRERLDSVA